MVGATKVLGATALVALVVGLLVVVTPLGPESDVSAPGPAVEAPRAEPVEFEGRWTYGPALSGGDYDFSRGDGWYDGTDLGWSPGVVDAGDPRLDGEIALRASSLRKDGLEIWHGAFRIENDGGAWQQRPTIQSVKLRDAREPMAWTAVFDGEGGYAGLTAIIGITRVGGGWDVEGVIIDAPLPPPPTILTRE